MNPSDNTHTSVPYKANSALSQSNGNGIEQTDLNQLQPTPIDDDEAEPQAAKVENVWTKLSSEMEKKRQLGLVPSRREQIISEALRLQAIKNRIQASMEHARIDEDWKRAERLAEEARQIEKKLQTLQEEMVMMVGDWIISKRSVPPSKKSSE